MVRRKGTDLRVFRQFEYAENSQDPDEYERTAPLGWIAVLFQHLQGAHGN